MGKPARAKYAAIWVASVLLPHPPFRLTSAIVGISSRLCLKGLIDKGFTKNLSLQRATSALCGRAGPVTFANRGKSNQKRLPLHPASSSGARNGRDPHKSPGRCAHAQPLGSWCGSTTARRSAPRRGLKGRSNSCLIASQLANRNPDASVLATVAKVVRTKRI